MDVRWILAGACEAAFWALLVAFLLLRYRFGRDGASVAVLVAIVADHLVLLGLAAWDFAETGGVSAYTVAIVALLLYALTAGRRDVARVDAWAKRRFSPRPRRPRPEALYAPPPPR